MHTARFSGSGGGGLRAVMIVLVCYVTGLLELGFCWIPNVSFAKRNLTYYVHISFVNTLIIVE